ncbi:hypothetical protein [Rhodopirellula sallentina]|nr:hypothetical protein [Rhodopirellula sallentina]
MRWVLVGRWTYATPVGMMAIATVGTATIRTPGYTCFASTLATGLVVVVSLTIIDACYGVYQWK